MEPLHLHGRRPQLRELREISLQLRISIFQRKNQLKNYTNISLETVRKKGHSSFIDNIQGGDIADMQLISKFNKQIHSLLCVIDIFSKYAWDIPLKDKKGTTTTNVFQIIFDESKRKPNKIWVDKGREFYNRSIKSLLEKNDIQRIIKENLLLLKDSLEP